MEGKSDKKGSEMKKGSDRSDESSDSDSSLLDISCDTCGMNFSSPKSYESHLKGKKHHKAVAQAKFLSKNIIASKKKGEESKSDDEDDDDDSKELYCEVCDKYISGHISYITHVKGKGHAKNVKKQKLKEKMVNMPEVLDNDNKENEDDDEILQKPYARCSVCEKEFTGPESYQMHLKSLVHRKKIQQSKSLETLKAKYQDESKKSDNEEEYYTTCKVCDKAFSGPVPFQIHMESKMHKKNLEKVKIAEEVKEFYITGGEGNGYLCKECKKTFTDPKNFKHHLANNSHEKQKAKNALLGFLNPHPEIEFVIPFKDHDQGEGNDKDASDSEYYLICKICHVSFSGPESAQDHVKSKKHINLQKEKKLLKFLKEKKELEQGEQANNSLKLNGIVRNETHKSNTTNGVLPKDEILNIDEINNSEKDDFEMI